MPTLRSGSESGTFSTADQLDALVYGGSDVASPVEPGIYEEPYVAPGQDADQAPQGGMFVGEAAAAHATQPATQPATPPESTPAGWSPGVSTQAQGDLTANPAREFAAPATAPYGGASQRYGGESAHRPLGNSNEVATSYPSTGGATSYRSVEPLGAGGPATAPANGRVETRLPQHADAGRRFLDHWGYDPGSARATSPARLGAAQASNPALLQRAVQRAQTPPLPASMAAVATTAVSVVWPMAQ